MCVNLCIIYIHIFIHKLYKYIYDVYTDVNELSSNERAREKFEKGKSLSYQRRDFE